MKSYQIDVNIVVAEMKRGKRNEQHYSVGLFVRACNPYNAVLRAYERLKEDLPGLTMCHVCKVEEVEGYEESE